MIKKIVTEYRAIVRDVPDPDTAEEMKTGRYVRVLQYGNKQLMAFIDIKTTGSESSLFLFEAFF